MLSPYALIAKQKLLTKKEKNFIEKLQCSILECSRYDDALFSPNMKIHEHNGEYLVIFYKDAGNSKEFKYCAYMINQINTAYLDIAGVDYSEYLPDFSFTRFTKKFITIPYVKATNFGNFSLYMQPPVEFHMYFDLSKFNESKNSYEGMIKYE